MNTFHSIQKSFEVLSLYSTSSSKTHSYNARNLLILLILCVLTIGTNIFLLFYAETFKEITDSFYTACSGALTVLSFSTTIPRVPKIKKLLEEFRNLINNRIENPFSKEIYNKTNEEVEKLCGVADFAIRNISLPCVMWPKLLISFFLYFIKKVDGNAFELPFPMWLPFDYQNLNGYLIAFVFEYMAFFCIILIAVCHSSFIPGTFWMLVSLTHDVENDLRSFNDIAKFKEIHQSEKLRKLNEVILFQSEANQLAAMFSDAFELNFLFFFTWSVFTICGALLMIQMEISQNGIDPFLLVIPTCEMFWSFALVFIFCEFGERVSTGFTGISKTINQFEWYSFPFEIIQTLPMVICYSQRPVAIKGIGDIACVRVMFKGVVSKGFKVFMMLRKVGE